MSEIFSKILKDKNGKVLNVGSKYTQPEWGAEENGVALPETACTINLELNAAPILVPFNGSMSADGVYTVTFNGVEYKCPAFLINGMGIALGNAAASGAPDAPESDAPFVLMQFYPTYAAEMGFYGMVMPLNGSQEFTISVKGKITHTIPESYLNNNIYIVSQDINFEDGATFVIETPFADILAAIKNGKQVYLWQPGGEKFAVIAWSDFYIAFGKMKRIASKTINILSIEIHDDGNAYVTSINVSGV